jgi:TrmH family RNA methyltransferase
MEVLTNNEVKQLKQLKIKKYRAQEKCFIIEGEKLIQEAMEKQPDSIRQIIVRSDCAENKGYEGYNVKIAQPKQMEKISALKTPPNAIAVLDFFQVKRASDFIIALDGVQNPGNLGTIIRSAAWMGCYRIIASLDTVEVYNPKVIQATMGSVFDVSVQYVNLVNYIDSTSLPVYGATMDGQSIYECQAVNEGILVMGSEGQGISKEVQDKIEHLVSIPKLGKGESLNVAMATGILLAEFNRKRNA